jgi:hypothetical protein
LADDGGSLAVGVSSEKKGGAVVMLAGKGFQPAIYRPWRGRISARGGG